ncbi:DUF86 domain-containing protein [Candidatus Pacearchaeota archaeon]|nr:DUF86 domain-containing protein [Candidatus Pacearchaeota archaeon]
MKRDLRLFYGDIYDSICLIEKYIGRGDFSKFRKDIKLVDSVVRRVEIIGEAIKHIPKEVRDKYPDVLWNSYVDSRNFLIHVYFGVNYLRLWGFVKNKLPVLKESVNKLLEEENGRKN